MSMFLPGMCLTTNLLLAIGISGKQYLQVAAHRTYGMWLGACLV